ncbi:MAG TPA: hypothetical protein VFI23_18830 [Rhizomicrobium sp.]|nr:hypothetical protein [Rhizomicrobium sp.]
MQVDGDDILGLVVFQRDQDALEQVTLRRGLANSSRRLFGGGLLDGLLGGL